MKKLLMLLGCISGLILAACSGINFTEWRFPYMYPVQQGNYITNQQLAQLKAGMTKEQVGNIVGHPVSNYMFNSNQWQYVYQSYKNDKLVNSYIINVNFTPEQTLLTVESAGNVFSK